MITSEKEEKSKDYSLVEGWVKTYTLSRIPNKETSEDIVQMVFESVMLNLNKHENILSVKGYLFSILKNKIADYYRDQYKKPDFQSFDELTENQDYFDENGNWKPEMRPDRNDQSHLLDDPEFSSVLQKCIQTLPPRMNSVIQLKYVDGRESQVIIEELGLTINNFWQLIHRAKFQLKKCVENHWFK